MVADGRVASGVAADPAAFPKLHGQHFLNCTGGAHFSFGSGVTGANFASLQFNSGLYFGGKSRSLSADFQAFAR